MPRRIYSKERNRKISVAMTRHGMSDSPEYGTWERMRQRCNNPKCKQFKNYGGRGIKICRRWASFENFYSDMGNRPSSNHQIDRIKNNEGYRPNNCKWSTHAEQQKNKRNCVYIEYEGKRLTVSDWSRLTGIPRRTIAWRMGRGRSTKIVLEQSRYVRRAS